MPYADIIAAKKELEFMTQGLEFFKSAQRKQERMAMINCFIRLVNAGETVYSAPKTYEIIDALIVQAFANTYALRCRNAEASQMHQVRAIRDEIGLYLSFGAKAAFEQLAFELAVDFLSSSKEIPQARKVLKLTQDKAMLLLLADTQEHFQKAIKVAVREIASRCGVLPYADLKAAKQHREDLVQQYNALPEEKRGNKARTINTLTALINTVEQDVKQSKLADCVCCLILHQLLAQFEATTTPWTLERLAAKVSFKPVFDIESLVNKASEVITNDVFAHAQKQNADGTREPLTAGAFKDEMYNDCKQHYVQQVQVVLSYLQDSYGLWKN